MVRKRGTERTALAFQRSAQVGIGTTYNGMRRRSAVGAGRAAEHTSELHSYLNLICRLLLARNSSTAHAQHPRLLLHQISPWAGRPLFGGECSFFFNDTATTEIYTLSLHDALPT